MITFFLQIPFILTPLQTRDPISAFWGQNVPMELPISDVKRSVAMFETLFGVSMSICKGAMAPGIEVTFFLYSII